jgi:hypothetical protein
MWSADCWSCVAVQLLLVLFQLNLDYGHMVIGCD